VPLDPSVAALLGFLQASGVKELHEGSVAEARANFRRLAVDFRDPSSLAPVASVDDITVAGSLPARVYRPDGDGPRPTVVYLHGGGFVIGDLDTHEGVCRALCRDVGAVVVSVAYRLAPEAPFPAAVDDAWAALQDVAKRVDEFGGDAERLAVGGDSAGGNLAAVCAQEAAAAGLPLAAQLLLYPATDLLGDYGSREENASGYFLTLADMRWFAQNYLGIGDHDSDVGRFARDPRVSPLHAESLSGLAPAVVATAEFDPLRDEGERYADALAAAGVDVRHRRFPGLIHGFYGLEQFSPAIAAASRWVNEQLADLLR
jgi:acetyl esterase